MIIDTEYCVARHKRSIAELSRHQDGTWQINRVFIQPEDRKKGIGRALLNQAIFDAIDQGAEKIFVIPGGYNLNQEEQYQFYEKCGFQHDTLKRGLMWYKNIIPL